LKIGHGLTQLSLGVHHERTVARDRLVELPPGHEDEPRSSISGPRFHGIAIAEHRETSLRHSGTGDLDAAS